MKTTPATACGTIYTLGYWQPGAAARLERLMRQRRVLLLDVRLQPRSSFAHRWTHTALSTCYGARYVWEPRLGNARYREAGHIVELAEGHEQAGREAAARLSSGMSLVLLCACADEATCHRTLVAKLIQDALAAPYLAAREVRV